MAMGVRQPRVRRNTGAPSGRVDVDDGDPTGSAATVDLAALVRRLSDAGHEHGLDAVGITSAEPLLDARAALHQRKAAGLHDTMAFTYKNPERSTDPRRALRNATSVVVGARSYRRADPAQTDPAAHGRVARYSWIDHYAPLKAGLRAIGDVLRSEGYRTVVLADDNSMVDRAVAQRAGIGWIGTNANLLIPGRGSWFVLGSVVTDARLPASTEPVADGCGSCVRCLDGCPTGAIVAPGTVDARRCLAWLVQRPGVFPSEFREALGDRIYGCDDCQEVCPPNRVGDRRRTPPPAEAGSQPWIHLLDLLRSTDAELLGAHGRFYLPERNVATLRRNALLAIGNTGDGTAGPVREQLEESLTHADPIVRGAAVWAVRRLGLDRALLGELHASEVDVTVRAELIDQSVAVRRGRRATTARYSPSPT